jgi:hypothetical protein
MSDMDSGNLTSDPSESTRENAIRASVRMHHRRRYSRSEHDARKFWEWCVIALMQAPNISDTDMIELADTMLVAWRERFEKDEPADREQEA